MHNSYSREYVNTYSTRRLTTVNFLTEYGRRARRRRMGRKILSSLYFVDLFTRACSQLFLHAPDHSLSFFFS